MTNFKQYFRSHLKANLRPFLYIFVAVLVFTFLLETNMAPHYETALTAPVILICVLAYILPVMEFSFFKKRINLDCAYSLPISRRAMGTVHYLTGLGMLLITFSASYLLNFLLLLSRKGLNLTPMTAHYFLCLLLGFAMYSVMVFVFNEANTRGDGIWFMVLYTFVFALILALLPQFSSKLYGTGFSFIPWGSFALITEYYQYLVESEWPWQANFWQAPQKFIGFFFWIVAGIASTVGFFLTFGKRRMERTEEISDSHFGFRTLIPVYAIFGMLATGEGWVIGWLIIECLAILGYTIYHRGFHYKKSEIILLLLLLLFL